MFLLSNVFTVEAQLLRSLAEIHITHRKIGRTFFGSSLEALLDNDTGSNDGKVKLLVSNVEVVLVVVVVETVLEGLGSSLLSFVCFFRGLYQQDL